jgi:hypothetical protein
LQRLLSTMVKPYVIKNPTTLIHTHVGGPLCYGHFSFCIKYMFASNTQKFLVQWLGAIIIWPKVIVLRVQDIRPNVVLPKILIFMWLNNWAPRMIGNDQKKKYHLHNLPEIIGQMFFELPKFFEAWRYFQNAHKFLSRNENYLQHL